MSKHDAAELHHVSESNVRRWCAEKIETDTGVYGGEHGRRPVVHPLTRRGLAQFVALARKRQPENFHT